MINLLIQQKKKIATMLLLIFISNIVLPVISYSTPMPDNAPVSSSLANYVNPFTGDFNYTVPLMTVPGPNGENFPITLGYSAGIKMNQEASWIGLGWDFNPGEIVRNVQGAPDDWKNSMVYSTDYLPRIGEQKIKLNHTSFFGPLYFNEFEASNYTCEYNQVGLNAYGSMDVYQTKRMMGEHLFQFPNYDDYYVSAPGLSGQITPNLFDYSTLLAKGATYDNSLGTESCNKLVDPNIPIFQNTRNMIKNFIVYKHNLPNLQQNKDPECKSFSLSKRLQFRFKNEFPSRINAPVNYREGLYKTPSNNDVGDYKVASVDLSSLNSTKKMPSGTVVNYFTNYEIATNKANILNFVDFQSTSLAPNQGRDITGEDPKFPQNGIGAFQIITPDGMMYHYSLPIYSKNNIANTFTIKNDPNNIEQSNKFVDDENAFTVTYKKDKFAVTWKLTAITGPDFEDVNNNKVIDDADKGYYISFNYGLFKENIYQQFPYYGFVADFVDRFEPVLGSQTHPKHMEYSYNRQGAVVRSLNEHYYLNSIKTATHTAFFIKDIRLDSHSKKTNTLARVPKLKLTKIILVKNENIVSFPNSTSIYETSENRFDLNVNSADVIHMNSYNQIKSQLDPVTIKTVELNQDYSLCPNFYANVNFNSTCSETAIETFNSSNFDPKNGENYTSTSPNISINVFDYLTNQNCNSSINNSGKLTLKSIRFKEMAAIPLFPSYEFDYDENNPIKNPNYFPDQQDYWGYYKSDFDRNYRGHYVTNESKNNVDAWSLKKITTPLGADIIINYESDSYSKVGYNSDEFEKLSDPQTTFLIRRVISYNNTNAVLEFFDKDATKFITNLSIRKFGLPLICSGQPVMMSNITNVDQHNNRVTISIANCNGTVSLDEGIKGYFTVFRPTFQSQALSYGGGLRVSAISIKESATGQQYTQEYVYENGVCTTEPDAFALINNNNDVLRLSNFSSDRHVLAPNVGYTNVIIKDKSINNLYNGKTEIEFSNYRETLRPNIVSTNIHSANADIYKNNGIEIKENKNTTYSLPISIKVYDKNDNIISKTINEYLSEKELETSGALVEEAFHVKYQTAYHIITPCEGNTAPYYSPWTIQNYTFVKKQYTNVLKKQTVYQNDMKVVTDYLEFDPITGKAIKTAVTDPSEGITVITEVPAYRLDGNNDLGSKIENSTNKNILALEGKKEIRKGKINYDVMNLNPLNEAVLVDGAKNIYGKSYLCRNWNASTSKYESNLISSKWKLLKTLSFNGNLNDNQWKTNDENTLYDANGNLIEVMKDNRYAAIKFSNKNRIIAKGKNTNYTSFLYSSFEELDYNPSFFASEISGLSRRVQSNNLINPHTGLYMLKIPATTKQVLHNAAVYNNNAKGLIPGKTYIAKVWMHKDNAPLSGIYVSYKLKKQGGAVLTSEKIVYKTDGNNVQVGDWILASLIIDIPGNIIDWNENIVEIGLRHDGSSVDSYFDDVVFSPVDAEVMGYVYNSTDQLSAEMNTNGMFTFYEYDAAGRVVKVFKETLFGLKKISERQYNFSR
jgi:hypothetical protein